MSNGKIMLDAVRATFPIVDKLCIASADECENLLQTFELLPEKAIQRIVKDGRIKLDGDTEQTAGDITAIIVGPESDLLSRKGTMKIAIRGKLFGVKSDNSLHIYCDNRPIPGAEYEVLHYSTSCTEPGQGLKYSHRNIYLNVGKDGLLSVREEVTGDVKMRGFTRSEYRNKNAEENE